MCPAMTSSMAAVREQVVEGKGYYNGDSLHIHGQDVCRYIPTELWVHVENVLGEKLTGEKPTVLLRMLRG